MITTNIGDDDDANLLMKRKIVDVGRTIVWNKIGVRPGRSVESVFGPWTVNWFATVTRSLLLETIHDCW